jgi:hypothetical protein
MVAADLRPIYEAPTAEEAARQLDAFEDKWAGKYPSIAPAWRRAWAEVIPFFAFSAYSGVSAQRFRQHAPTCSGGIRPPVTRCREAAYFGYQVQGVSSPILVMVLRMD